MNPMKFDPAKFNLLPDHFEHQSLLHGIKHTYRVMCHVLFLGRAINRDRETKLAFCAAFIHDMSRLHDGFCTMHGLRASEDKLPVFKEFFLSQGVNLYEIEEIKTAVRNHSEGFELPEDHPFRKTCSLLKDADALDRIRLGEKNLDPSYLRFAITPQLVPYAKELYFKSEWEPINRFADMLRIAELAFSESQSDSNLFNPEE